MPESILRASTDSTRAMRAESDADSARVARTCACASTLGREGATSMVVGMCLSVCVSVCVGTCTINASTSCERAAALAWTAASDCAGALARTPSLASVAPGGCGALFAWITSSARLVRIASCVAVAVPACRVSLARKTLLV